MFFLAVAELFGFDGGRPWHVVHQVLAPTRTRTLTAAGR